MREWPRCADCGAPYNSEKGTYDCVPLPRGSGVTYIKEGQMAQGELVALTHRTFVNAGKTAVAEEGTPEAAWYLGGEGVQISKDYAIALGLKEGEDFGEPNNGMNAYLDQERKNREAGALSSATFVQPLPAMGATTPDRRTLHRETGEPVVDSNLATAETVMPGVLQQPHHTPGIQAETRAGQTPEAHAAVTGASDADNKDAEKPADKPQTGSATRAQPAPATRERAPSENK